MIDLEGRWWQTWSPGAFGYWSVGSWHLTRTCEVCSGSQGRWVPRTGIADSCTPVRRGAGAFSATTCPDAGAFR